MEVTLENLSKVIAHIKEEGIVGLDTETTGLRPYHGDVLFSIILSTLKHDFYLNFNTYIDAQPLPDKVFKVLSDVMSIPELVVVFHNAKFDLAFLRKEEIEVKGDVVDIWALDRLDYNDHFQYSLSEIAKRRGFEKSDIVEEYIAKHKLWEWVELSHLNKRFKNKRYNEVPYEVIKTYGEKDGHATRHSFEKIRASLAEKDALSANNLPKLQTVAANEAKLTKTLFEMEWTGVQVDAAYCEEAAQYYVTQIEKVKKDFFSLTGVEFQKSPTIFKELFKDEQWAFTEKNNPIFDAKALRGFSHPAAKLVVEYSESKKQLEYFQGFLYHMDETQVIHTNFKQAGTATGRLSSGEPNMQNLTKPDKYETSVDESLYPVRRAFVPRPGYFFAMLDWDQQEYRMMLDMAGADGLIDKVLGGLDVHQATADVAGITRQQAKTCNFAVLYGSGIKTLAKSLGTTESVAKETRDAIFRAAPEIRDFIRRVIRVADRRGYIFNWLGRRSYFPNKNFCYKAPNYLIQGGCADVVKVAMNECHDFLWAYKSRMLLTIHDEIIFEIHEDEAYVVPELQKILERVYPDKRLPLTCGIDFSTKSLADKVPWEQGAFSGTETRDDLQRASTTET